MAVDSKKCTGILENVLVSILTMEEEPNKSYKMDNVELKLKVTLNSNVINKLCLQIDSSYCTPVDTVTITRFVKEYIDMNHINITNILVRKKSKFNFIIDLSI